MMKREDAFEGQKVRVTALPDDTYDGHYAGQQGTIIQIWPDPEYKWYEWATVDFTSIDECAHILFENLEPLEEQGLS